MTVLDIKNIMTQDSNQILIHVFIVVCVLVAGQLSRSNLLDFK